MRASRLLALAVVLCVSRPACPSPVVVNVNANEPGGHRLSVVTYNMLHGFGNRLNDDTLDERLALLSAALLLDAPDIVILQEASVTHRHGNVVDRLRDMLNAGLAARGVSYNSAHLLENGSGLIRFFEGSAILSRYRIVTAEGLAFRAQALLPPERRVALRVHLTGPTGRVSIIGTHLTNTGARIAGRLVRTRQAEELAAWIASDGSADLTVLGGDLNDSPGSQTLGALAAVGGRDAWLEAAGQGRAPGQGLTALNGTVRDVAGTARERIDYLFVFGPTTTVEGAATFLDSALPDGSGRPLWASDHIGVRAELSVR
jgi:endonuclease/exonuclease/phosphatase family metal-dependent hydrolase